METLPIELIAEIAMYDAKTWASMLLVFRGLRAEYFDVLARKRLIEYKTIDNWRTTKVNNKLHSVDDQPALSSNNEFDCPDWDFLRGETKIRDVPLVDAARIVQRGEFTPKNPEKEKKKLIFAATACEIYWQTNLQGMEKVTSTRTRCDRWYKNGELRRENGPYSIMYTVSNRSYFYAYISLTRSDTEKDIILKRWSDVMTCEFIEDGIRILKFDLHLPAYGPQN